MRKGDRKGKEAGTGYVNRSCHGQLGSVLLGTTGGQWGTHEQGRSQGVPILCITQASGMVRGCSQAERGGGQQEDSTGMQGNHECRGHGWALTASTAPNGQGSKPDAVTS